MDRESRNGNTAQHRPQRTAALPLRVCAASKWNRIWAKESCPVLAEDAHPSFRQMIGVLCDLRNPASWWQLLIMPPISNKHGHTTVQLALRMSYQPEPTDLGLVTTLDHLPISRYNVPMTRRTEFVTYRPKTILNEQKRPDHWFWTCCTAYPYKS
jgi:hypothetical protein